MIRRYLLLILIFAPGILYAQFEQKLSLNVSAGYFKTIGWSGWEENWGDHGPSLMPNFKGGPSLYAGLQYNFSRHLSLEIQFGYSFAPGWYFNISDEGEEPYNYLNYDTHDLETGEVDGIGENYMDMTNFHMGIAPRYYFIPGNRFNPFIYAGVTLNYTSVYIEDNEYADLESKNRLDLYEGDANLVNWFDYQVAVGFMAGAGVDYSLNDAWGLFAMVSYHFNPMKDASFFEGSYLVDYHDLSIHLGARFSFLKSKEL